MVLLMCQIEIVLVSPSHQITIIAWSIIVQWSFVEYIHIKLRFILQQIHCVTIFRYPSLVTVNQVSLESNMSCSKNLRSRILASSGHVGHSKHGHIVV